MRIALDWVFPALLGSAVGVALVLALGAPGARSVEVSTGVVADRQPVASLEPSALAERTIPDPELDLYRSTAADLDLDWTVLAAVDRLEIAGQPNPLAPEQRIPGLAYALQAAGAPTVYADAIAARGSTGLARRALALADRLGASGAVRPPTSRGPLATPVEGPVLAAYGQTYGALHDGIDIAAETGAEILAPADGVVVSAGADPLYGEYTCVAHRLEPALGGLDELTSCVGNQSAIEVSVGDLVSAGELIGRVGCSGPCLRPHAHFQVREGAGPTGPTIDPVRVLDPDLGAIVAGRPLELEAR